MVFFDISLVCGLVGGVFSSHFMKEYSLGLTGNIVTGFLGGAAAHTLLIAVLNGSAFSLAIVGGFLGGIIVRVAFAIIRQRMTK